MAMGSAAGDALTVGVLATTFGFGLRHGIDWDHIAAITDISSSQETSREGLKLATLYALGHAAVVFALGVAAIGFGERLPAGIDAIMERFVGATLVLLGVYVIYALLRHGRDFRMRSRWMLLFAGARRAWRWLTRRTGETVTVEHEHEHPVEDVHHGPDSVVGPPTGTAPSAAGSGEAVQTVTRTHRHRHRHVAPMPDDPFATYGTATAFGVGMIHGVGAETPTQVVVFLTAAGVAGVTGGVLLLGVFLLGLLVSNSVIAVASSFGFFSAERSFPVYATISVVTGVFSLVVGSLFLFGDAGWLPALFGG